MNVEFLEANEIRLRLRRYMEEYEEFHWAVAWAAHPNMAKELFAHRSKFRNVTFGVAFSQTAPDVVDALVGVDHGYIATRFEGGTYHPKVYCFRTGRRVAALVGSANFTGGGLGANLEAAVALTGTMDDAALSDIITFARRSAGYGRQVTKPYADAYRASCIRAARLPKAPRNPVPEVHFGAVDSIVMKDWDEYVRRLQDSRHHDMARSLELLAIARRWFATDASFAHFSAAQRKAIAGTLGEYQKIGPELDRDWGWFGSMRGAGDFANRIEQNDRFLAKALDSIQSGGEVTRAQYERFCKLFRQAFAGSSRTGGVPTATRLLSMKRPDTFLCICKPNIVQAAKELGFSRTTLDLENYWDRVVEPIRLSNWYNADKPDYPDGELWEARVAMLDVLFYRP
jgi:hypothetical protein